MGWIASEHKETKKKRKKEKRKKEAVQDTHVPWTREKKERKTPRRHLSPGPGVPLLSPRHLSASHSHRCRPLAVRCHLISIILVFSFPLFSPCRSLSSHSRHSPLAIHCCLIPVILIFSSPSFSPCRSSSPHPRHCHPPMEHPASSGGGGC